MFHLRARLYTAASIVCLPAALLAAQKSNSGYEQIQLIRGPQNHLIMPAMVNGQAANFLLDTGVDLSFLQADRAQRLGLQRLGRDTFQSGQTFPLAEARELRAGGVDLGQAEFALYQPSQLGGPVPGVAGRAADGLLGLNLLRRNRAVINCRTKQIFFKTDPARRLDLNGATRGLGFTRIPISENARGYLSVPCSIGNRAGVLILDTGAFLTGLDDETARRLELKRTPSRATARGLDGRTRPIELAQVNDLRIGSVAIAPQKLIVTDVFAAQKTARTFTGIRTLEFYTVRDSPRPREIVFGLLGNELLDQRRAIIDLESMALFLK